MRDEQGKPVQSRLDEKRLSEIAKATGGFYAPLTPDVARKIYADGIEPMATRDTGMLSTRVPTEQYQWPLGAALGCLVLWMLIGEGRGRRKNGTRKVPAAVAAVALGGLFAMNAQAVESGIEQYQKGDYKGALASFEKDATMTPEKEKAQFDAGAAAYKGGDYAKAITHFTSALLADEDALRASASYNLGNALVRRGEQAKSDESKEKDWKDAIAHYDETLKIHPSDADAKANREIAKKLLEDLKKKQEQQKQQQQQQNQQQNQQNKDDQQKQDQQQQQNKDQQKQDQKDQKQDQQKKDQQQGGSSSQNDQQKQQDQQNKQDHSRRISKVSSRTRTTSKSRIRRINRNQQQSGQQKDQQKQDQQKGQGEQNKPDQISSNNSIHRKATTSRSRTRKINRTSSQTARRRTSSRMVPRISRASPSSNRGRGISSVRLRSHRPARRSRVI